LDLKVRNPSRNVEVYTFGAPRVGNQAFALYADGQFPDGGSWRMTNLRDPIPRVPLKIMDYFHITREIWRANETGYRICDPLNGEDPTCIDRNFLQDPLDHATYMGISVLNGVANGCLWFDP